MLRFDLPPVYSNVARVQAAVTLIVCLASIGGYGWAAGLTLMMGFVRGFVSPRQCPSHILIEKVLLKLGKAGKKENAGAKMFADKLLFVASTAIVSLWAVDSCFYLVPSYVLAVFAALDLFLGFCAGCWAFNLWQVFVSRRSENQV